jgi:hypothetical protein
MKTVWLLLLLPLACVNGPQSRTMAPDEPIARGPWTEVPAMELSTGDLAIPIGFLRDVADALLKRPGATVCDPARRLPIKGLSTEYCATVYVAGPPDSMSWRVSEPIQGDHETCNPFFAVEDADHPSSRVWVVGYVHNHPCGAAPSSADLSLWPTDAFDPAVSMTELRMIPGNPAPAVFQGEGIQMSSALVAERQDGSRFFLRYFPTGEVQQWSQSKTNWVTLGRCTPRRASPPFNSAPQCIPGALRVLHE